jgi:hypothetical protein
MPTPRKHKTSAARQKAYRERKKREEREAAEALAKAVDHPLDALGVDADAEADAVSPPMAAILSADPSRAVLESIRDNPKALDSDRIRAATEIQKIAALEKASDGGTSDLVEVRRILEALPHGDRLPFLRGELEEHRAARAAASTTDEGETT